MTRDALYPLFPVLSVITAFHVLVILLIGFYRRSWNLAISILFFWIFFNASTLAANAIIWTDNLNISHRRIVYCDIITHVEVFSLVSIPACSLIITRRLYLIASQDTGYPWQSSLARRLNFAFEFFMILLLPAVTCGVSYYFSQASRFAIYEGYGCFSAARADGFTILTIDSLEVIFPAMCIFIYYPKIVIHLYRHNREISQFLDVNDITISRTVYYRIVFISCMNVIFILPIGIVNVVAHARAAPNERFLFFLAEPLRSAIARLIIQRRFRELDGLTQASVLLYQWGTVLQGTAIFATFGFTREKREVYWQWLCTFCRLIGCQFCSVRRQELDPMTYSHGTEHRGERGSSLSAAATPLSRVEMRDAATSV